MAQVRAKNRHSFVRAGSRVFEMTGLTLATHVIPEHMNFESFIDDAKSILLVDVDTMLTCVGTAGEVGGLLVKKGGQVDFSVHLDRLVGISGTGTPAWGVSVRTRMIGQTRRALTVVPETCQGSLLLSPHILSVIPLLLL